MQDFKNLEVWQKAHRLVLETYAKTANFPKHEQFGLTSQVRRAATSIAANIVEGSSRRSDKEFAQFLRVASGSASEVEYFSILIADLSMLGEAETKSLGEKAVEVRRMLAGLLKSLSRPRPRNRLAARRSQLAAPSSQLVARSS